MSKTTRFLGAVALSMLCALPARAEDMTASTVIATVNGTEITLGHMLMLRSALPEQYQQLPDEVLWDGILDQLIQQQVLSTDSLAKETRKVQLALENERRSLLAGEAVAAIAAGAVSDKALQDAYEAQYLQADLGKEYNASHILVASQEEAEALVTELSGGAEFAELARAKSTGPSGPNGGQLGWFSRGMMVEPFQEAVETLEPGGISGPVATQFGWHVIKLNETRVKEAPELDAVRGELTEQLQQQAVEKKIEALLAAATLTSKRAVDIDPSILSKTELLEE